MKYLMCAVLFISLSACDHKPEAGEHVYKYLICGTGGVAVCYGTDFYTIRDGVVEFDDAGGKLHVWSNYQIQEN